MKFGRLHSVEGVDFALPPDDEANRRVLATGRERGVAPRVLVGTSGWSDRRLVGPLYPPGTSSRDFLALYSRTFAANELNSTFYGIDAGRISAWAASAPPDFRFCPKLPREVSHDRRFVGCEAEMESFCRAARGFGDQLGRAFAVAPPDFEAARLADLEAFCERWARELPLAIELRHASWFADAGLARDFGQLFEAHGVVAVLTDVAGRRDVLHMRLTAPEVFLRFVGNALHPSDCARLDDWACRVGAWISEGLETAYLFLHMAEEPHTLELARHWVPRLAQATGLPLGLELPAGPLGAGGQLELF